MGKPTKLSSQILAVMERAFGAGSELALLDVVSFCDENRQPLPSWALRGLAVRVRAQVHGEKLNKKTGRHAGLGLGQQPDLVFEAECFKWVTEFREEGHKKEWGVDAFSRAATKLHAGENTVTKAYYRFRNKKPSQRYISLLYLQGDYIGFLQHNSLL